MFLQFDPTPACTLELQLGDALLQRRNASVQLLERLDEEQRGEVLVFHLERLDEERGEVLVFHLEERPPNFSLNLTASGKTAAYSSAMMPADGWLAGLNRRLLRVRRPRVAVQPVQLLKRRAHDLNVVLPHALRSHHPICADKKKVKMSLYVHYR